MQPAHPATQRQTGDPGVGDGPGRRREAVSLRRASYVAQRAAGVDARPARVGVDPDAAHRREVDDESVVAHGQPGHAVPAAAHRREQLVLTGEPDRGDHVGGVRAPGDQPRPSLDHAVPDRPRFVVRRGRPAGAGRRPSRLREVVDDGLIQGAGASQARIIASGLLGHRGIRGGLPRADAGVHRPQRDRLLAERREQDPGRAWQEPRTPCSSRERSGSPARESPPPMMTTDGSTTVETAATPRARRPTSSSTIRRPPRRPGRPRRTRSPRPRRPDRRPPGHGAARHPGLSRPPRRAARTPSRRRSARSCRTRPPARSRAAWSTMGR